MRFFLLICLIALAASQIDAKMTIGRRVQAVATTPSASTAVTNVNNGASNTINISLQVAVNVGVLSNNDWYRWVFGIIYMVVGLPLGFFGLRFWAYNAFTMAAFIGWIATNIIIGQWSLDSTMQWVAFCLALVAAIAVCIVFHFCKKIAGGLMGSALGFALYWFIFNFVANCNVAMAAWLSLTLLIVLVAAGLIFGCFFEKNMIITSSSVTGS